MSKRARHPPGFYEALLTDACDRGSKSKYRPIVKPTVMGVFEVERVVAKRIQGRETVYFVQWKHYSPEENTWEPADHLPEELIAAFALLFEKGLKITARLQRDDHNAAREQHPLLNSRPLSLKSILINNRKALT